MPCKNTPKLTIIIVVVLLSSFIGVGFFSSSVTAQSIPNDADAYLQDGGTYTQGQILYKDDLKSYELVYLYDEETGERIYTRRADENGQFYIPTEFNSPSTYRLEGEKSGVIATYTLEKSQTNSGEDDSDIGGVVTFQDYYGDGDPINEITVQEATLNEGGFLAVYKNGQFIEVSDYLSEGTHNNIKIDISSNSIKEFSTIRIAPYKDSNNNGRFDSNDDSYWGESSAQSFLAQYSPEEVPLTEPWEIPDDGEESDNNDGDDVFIPNGEDDSISGENNEKNPEGTLPLIPSVSKNLTFVIVGTIIVFLIGGFILAIGLIALRQIRGGTGFEEYDSEKDGKTTEKQDSETTTGSDMEPPDPTRVNETTGPTTTKEGPPGTNSSTAAESEVSSEEKGFDGVTSQEDLPNPVQREKDSIQSTEEENKPNSEPEEDEENLQPPTPLDEIEEKEISEDINEMEEETDTHKIKESEQTTSKSEEDHDRPESNEGVQAQSDMEEDVIEDEEPTESKSEYEQESDKDDAQDDTEFSSMKYNSIEDPMYDEDTLPSSLNEMEEEPTEEEENKEDSKVRKENTKEDFEDDESLGLFERLRSGLTQNSASEEEVDEETIKSTEESESQNVESDGDKEENKEDKEPTAADLIDGEKDDDPFSNV